MVHAGGNNCTIPQRLGHGTKIDRTQHRLPHLASCQPAPVFLPKYRKLQLI